MSQYRFLLFFACRLIFDQLNKILKRRIDVQIRLLDHQVTLCRVNVR